MGGQIVTFATANMPKVMKKAQTTLPFKKSKAKQARLASSRERKVVSKDWSDLSHLDQLAALITPHYTTVYYWEQSFCGHSARKHSGR